MLRANILLKRKNQIKDYILTASSTLLSTYINVLTQ